MCVLGFVYYVLCQAFNFYLILGNCEPIREAIRTLTIMYTTVLSLPTTGVWVSGPSVAIILVYGYVRSTKYVRFMFVHTDVR